MPTGIKFTLKTPSRKEVADLHGALEKLDHKIAPAELKANTVGDTTRAAIKAVQHDAGLTADGHMNMATLDALNTRVVNAFYTANGRRAANLQEMLALVGHPVAPAERTSRTVGPSTLEALRAFQQQAQLPIDGHVSDAVFDKLAAAAVTKRFSTKTQVAKLQRKLIHVARIAKIDQPIAKTELTTKALGTTTSSLIKAIQTKYKLPATGAMDPATLARIESVAASRGRAVAKVKMRAAEQLVQVRGNLRLNKTSQSVAHLQQALAFLGYSVDKTELENKTFGATTRSAVVAFQQRNGLPQNGHVETATRERLNAAILAANPAAPSGSASHRLRGSVRDKLWIGRPGLTVQLYERTLAGDGALLAQRKTTSTGFYDVPYTPPVDPKTGKVKDVFQLTLRVVDANGALVHTAPVFNPTSIAWSNFTGGGDPYLGDSEFDVRMEAITKVLAGAKIENLQESKTRKDITFVAEHTQLAPEDVMRLVLAHRVAAHLGDTTLTPDVFYGFLRQSLPPALPGDLILATVGWTLIDQLVDTTTEALVFMEPPVVTSGFDNATKLNLIPIATVRNRTAVLAAFAARRQQFALSRPILIGNGSLQSVLAASTMPNQYAAAVADAFIQHRGLGAAFWQDLDARAGQFGGADAVADLQKTAQIGHIAKHHVPTLGFLKQAIGSATHPQLKTVVDLAKLDHAGWVALINENGGQVPDGTDGATPQAKIDVYAATLAGQAEQLFPAVSLTAKLAPGGPHGLTRVTDVLDFISANADVDFATTNLDKLIKDRNLTVPADVVAQTKIVQRIHRVAPASAIATTLLDSKIHNSSQIVAQGRPGFVDAMTTAGLQRKDALTTFGRAELQYASSLALMTKYRFELYREHPVAVVPYTYSTQELQQLLGGIPNLETLFGSLDSCTCSDCQSLTSPAAYLADVLRFLNTHPSETAGKSVRDILFGRRPDLGNIKLGCDNTNVALPYIDLVCEILEAAVPPATMGPAFGYQTTGTAEELRAFPQNVRKDAWDAIRTAEWPIDIGFDLWEEEARVWLSHLGVPRDTLMTTFQDRTSATPSDAAIAAEGFGMSTEEASLVVSATDATAARQQVLWGFDAARTSVPVGEILDRAHLDYDDLLELVQVRWIGAIAIDRPDDTCNLELQSITNLTVERFDRIHRFLRLWRRTGWKMWELDLLLRAPSICNGVMDGNALTALRRARALQKALGLGVEETLALYQQINTETRTDAEDPTKSISSLYGNRFQNPTLTRPLDAAFTLPLPGTAALADHKPALLAGLGLRDADVDLLVARTDGKLTLDNLTALFRSAAMARGTGLAIDKWLMLVDLVGTNPLASPTATLDLLDALATLRSSGLDLAELDYLIAYRPDSPFGLRDETIDDYIADLTDTLRGAAPTEVDGRIVTHIAQTFSIRNDQARAFLDGLALFPPLRAVVGAPAAARDTYRLLHKATTLATGHKVDKLEPLKWLLSSAPAYGLLDLSKLPVTAAPAVPLFTSWLALARFLWLQGRYPEPENVSLRKIFDDAAAKDAGGNLTTPIATLRSEIEALTTWPSADLATIEPKLGVRYTNAANDYTSIDMWLRIAAVFDATKRLGVPVATPFAWAARDGAGDAAYQAAQEIRQAAASKYDYASWLTIATPLQDVLREKKRDALIRYHIESSQRTQPEQLNVNGKAWANPAYFVDDNSVLGYYLIDVDMCSCQLTSRIKQAMSSVQMFVQRCFLNLEQPDVKVSQEERADVISLDSWRQWKTMKSYRVWEANRKVFFYPENWIEPELRDDKSPFFKQLEDDLLKSDLTTVEAEAALRTYIESVEEVAHLEVVGASHQLDDQDAVDNLSPQINVLHVVGRTRAAPIQYFYRQYDFNYNRWTSWEQIDVDINGDHLVPVVYNRKLYLFWLLFAEKPQKAKKQPPAKASDAPSNAPDAPLQVEMQLAWSVRKTDGWTAKKLSKQKLIHPWQRLESSYSIKPRYKSRENQLWLDIYVSTSDSFNNKRFYDPYAGTYQFVTATRFDDTARPWHASSFVFDGKVVDLKMKPLRAYYHMPAGDGTLSDTPTWTTSLDYVRAVFGEDAKAINALSGPYEIAPRLLLPDGMHLEANHFTNNTQHPNSSRLSVLEQGASRPVLQGALSPFELVAPLDDIQVDTTKWGVTPFVYQDAQRAFFVMPMTDLVNIGYNHYVQQTRYQFGAFYHPYAALFVRELDRDGRDGLLNRRIQRFPETYYPANTFQFSSVYKPIAPHGADASSEKAIVDFTQTGAMAIYNWELFFHAPLLIATRLSQNQRFEEAMDWFHTIFDPTNVEALDAPQRFWITKPFFEENADDYRKQRIGDLLANLGANLDQVRDWKNHPFDPHLIARYRPVAYQKTVVMKYIDNLISWGDQLFAQDTLETINEATTLYVLAYEILGRRPVKVPHVAASTLTYNELEARGDLDPLGNESMITAFESQAGSPDDAVTSGPQAQPLPVLDAGYFCIPSNDLLLQYWDRVEDRLYKIRHCMNLQGVVRQLPLFEPPIDPALLVKAAAAGVDLDSVLADVGVAGGPYKYRALVAKALELCSDVRALGDRLRSCLEAQDAEGLALLRSSNEITVLQATKDIRRRQLDEAQANWDAQERAKLVAQARHDFYANREFINLWEAGALVLSGITALLEVAAISPSYALSSGLRWLPSITIGGDGFGGSPVVEFTILSGEKVSGSISDLMQSLQADLTAMDKLASIAATIGSYTRRKEEWDYQADQASKEMDQIDKQILAAQIRYDIAQKEADSVDLQIDNAKAVDDFLRSKFTNQQLFGWMVQQISTVYFQAYKLAFDMARKAEKAFQFELDREDLSFIQFGYWDSLRKGLLAGDRLAADIRRMEAAYLDQNVRLLEITKHVSLAQVAPLALLQLKQGGTCAVTLPEWLFDMDYPGHYRRRLRAVSMTIPCVVGPYSSVSCTLSLTNNGVRISDGVGTGYGDPLTTNDPTRFEKRAVAATSIATSHGRDDAGMFDVSFNDDRYLPFEGAGAVSEWQLQMSRDSNSFDLDTVSDVILHLRYTALAGGPDLVTAAKANLQATLPSAGMRMLSMRSEMSDAWHRFLFPIGAAPQTLAFTLGREHLPFYARSATNVKLSNIDLLIESTHAGKLDVALGLPGGALAAPVSVDHDTTYGGTHHLAKAIAGNQDVLGDWKIQIKKDSDATFDKITPADIQNAWLVMSFKLS